MDEYTAEELRQLPDKEIATLLYGVLLICTVEGARICKEAAERLKQTVTREDGER